MFCIKCGTQLPDGQPFCGQCGTQIRQHNQQSVQSTPVYQPEVVIMEGLCNRVKSKLFVQNGKGMLTNKRFVYFKHGFGKIMVMGALVNLTQGDIDFEIPISDIDHLEDGRQGVSKTIKVFTKAGEMYHFYFTKREHWIIAFQNVLAGQ